MNKITFILAMLFCPSLFAATLTPNTVPYVCQGGANPQLCNSNITTDSNGNATLGFGTWQSKSPNTIYQAATDGMVSYAVIPNAGTGRAYIAGITDSNPSPSTIRQLYDISQNMNGATEWGQGFPVRKGDYWEVAVNNGSLGFLYWLPVGK